jgi:PAS domain S-box-containing protein
MMSSRWRSLFNRYGVALVAVILATLLRMWLDPFLENRAPFSTYFVAIMFAAWYGGIGPSLVVMVVGALAADYFFINPRGSLYLYNWVAYDVEHEVAMVLYFLVGVVIALLSESLRAGHRRTEAARAALAEANQGLQTEITEREKAEQWLLESEQRFRAYFEQGLVGMVMLSANRDWIEANPRFCQLIGYTEKELMAKTWIQLTHPDDLPAEEASFRQMLGGEVRGFVMDKRFIRHDGKIVYASLSMQCMRKETGDVDCILALVQDMTDRKQNEQAIVRLNERLRNANQDLQGFTSSVCHDLRAPLRAIGGFSQILAKECAAKLDETAKDHLGQIQAGVQHMTALIDDLMKLSRVGRAAVRPESVNLSSLVGTVAEGLRKSEPQRSVEFAVQEGVTAVGDPNLLRVALENLLGNAWKFTSKHDRAHIEFGVEDQNGQPVYFVRDDGAGFDMKAAEKLFGVFQRMHRATEFAGTGVGLATVARIIRAHGGRVWAEAEVERGATFFFTLPEQNPENQE